MEDGPPPPALLDERLDALAAAGVGADLVGMIRRFVAEEPAPRLFRISPYRLAQDWALPRKSVLDAFLLATRQGIFDLEWSIRCPACLSPTDIHGTLATLKDSARCEGCRLDIRDAALDTHVQVDFRVGRAIRPVEAPSDTELSRAWTRFDSVARGTVPPGGEWVHEAELREGPYKVFSDDFQARETFWVGGEGAAAAPEIAFEYDGAELSWRAAAHAPGRTRIRVKNSSSRPLQANFGRMEQTPWVSGLDVASNQHFRDMFSAELISADSSFSVKNIILLFTDIRGSTNLYERRGDARAYALVKEHFEILFDAVRHHDGAVVKTIGDAVMASFLTPADAMRAILEAHDRFERFNDGRPSENAIIIKAGLHSGACIAVTLNDTLDYFGRMVNLAARVQGESHGGDIVVPKAFYASGEVAALAARAGWEARPRSAALKGIDGPIELVALTRGRGA